MNPSLFDPFPREADRFKIRAVMQQTDQKLRALDQAGPTAVEHLVAVDQDHSRGSLDHRLEPVLLQHQVVFIPRRVQIQATGADDDHFGVCRLDFFIGNSFAVQKVDDVA